MSSEMDKSNSSKIKAEYIPHEVEAWKMTIAVQQHFNTIEMQIRNLAITVLTAALGAAGLTNRPLSSTVLGVVNSTADWLIIAGLGAWFTFYFMDRWWYHRYLQAAVKHARLIEDEFTKLGAVGFALSSEIKEASPLIRSFPRLPRIGSNTRIDIFYGVVAFALILLIVAAF